MHCGQLIWVDPRGDNPWKQVAYRFRSKHGNICVDGYWHIPGAQKGSS